MAVAVAAVAGAAGAPAAVSAQTSPAVPPTIEACYVPASGTIYRINTSASPAPGAPNGCLSATHVRFLWNQQGPKGDKGDKGDPGSSATLPRTPWGGLSLDDPSGFASLGAYGISNSLGVIGPGARLLWYPRKAAFRVGGAVGSEWDDANIGDRSTAIGTAVTASGTSSFALGQYASTNRQQGAIVFGDASVTTAQPLANAPNQFVVRAAGGVFLHTTPDLQKGCQIDPAGNLTCTGRVTTGSGVLGRTFVRTIQVRVAPSTASVFQVVCPVGSVAVAAGGGSPDDGYVDIRDVQVSPSDDNDRTWNIGVRNSNPSFYRVLREWITCVENQ